jgi:hypothetical protein
MDPVVTFASELRAVVNRRSPPQRRSGRARAGVGLVPTTRPFAKAFACAVVACALGTAALVLHSLHQDPRQLASGTLGTATAQALAFAAVASFAPALVTGMVVQQSARAWRFRDIALAFLAMFAVTAALHAVGLAIH